MIPMPLDEYGNVEEMGQRPTPSPMHGVQPAVDPKAQSDLYTEMLKAAKSKEQAKSKATIKAIDAELAQINAKEAKQDLLTEMAGGEMTDVVQGAGSMLDDLSGGLHPEYDPRY